MPLTSNRPHNVCLGDETSGNHDVLSGDMTIVNDLIECRDWEGVANFFQIVPEVCFSEQFKSLTGNLPLHEVCKHQPPLSIVELLLDNYEEAIRTRGQNGYLPLHFACRNGACLEVVGKLIELHPAATRCRDDMDGALPIHLAAQWGSSEDVFLEILTAHPEGSFMRDNSGKIPMDYAESLPSSDTRSCAINALATAPILVATAKAAWARANLEWETRIAGIKEANAEYVRQMEEMHNLEKTSFLKMEIQFQNQLADEKEKNIALAESMIKQKTRAEELLAERNEARILLEKERAEFKFQSEEQDREISAIIQDSAGHPAGSKAENGRTYSLKEQLVEFATRYNETMAKKDVAEKDLTYNENMVKHLNQLLSNKDAEIEELTKMLKGKEESQQRSLSRLSKLTNLHNGMQRQLKSTKDELDRLQEHTSTLQQQLEQSNRILQIQESRFGNIKGLVHSLSYNIDSWAFDDQEWDQKTVVEGLETLKLKGANNGRNVPTTLEKADSDKSADTTNDTAAMDDEDISTLSPSPSPGRPSGRIKPV